MNLSEPRKTFLVASLLTMSALASLSACSSTEEIPKTMTHSACGVACTTDDIDCLDKSMRECVL